MPMIEVIAPAGAIPADGREALAERLQLALLKAERAPDNAATRAISWLYFDERPAESVVVGGKVPGQPAIRVKLTVPQFALSDRRKQEVVTEVTEILADALDDPHIGARLWVMVDEVTDGNWGGNGRVFRYEDIKALALAGGVPEAAAATTAS